MKNLAVLLLFFLLISCQKQTDWDLKTQAGDALVVEGIITSENKSQSIRISHTTSALDVNPLPVSGATVVVNDGDSVHVFTEQSSQSGVYNANFIGKEGSQFSLIINNQGKIYSAKSFMEPSVIFHPLTYSYNESKKLYQIDNVGASFNYTQNAMWEIWLDWSAVPGYENQNPANCKARLLYYTLPTLDVSEVLAPQMQQVYFPAGTIIVEKRYSINAEYAAFLRALLSETTWTGGMFDSNHANLPSNISSGALGFFAACGVSTLSMTVTP